MILRNVGYPGGKGYQDWGASVIPRSAGIFGSLFGMPWTLHHYPASMQNLPARVRDEAIKIANALLEEGMDEGKAIRIAIAKAKEWAERHPIPRD